MFKRFSTNYIVLLFLVDMLVVQVALGMAMRLRFLLPIGQNLTPTMAPEYIYVPTPLLHISVGVIWAISLTLGFAYTPRKIIHWSEELQHVLLSHTVAALCFAGLLYVGKLDLPRLTFIYFYFIALIGLIGYRTLLRLWGRLQRSHGIGVTRVLIIGTGRIGDDIIQQLERQNWSEFEIVGFLDDEPAEDRYRADQYPVLGKLDDAVDVARQYLVDEIIFALPLHAHARLANLVVRLQELAVRVHVVPDYFDLAFHAATIEEMGGIPLIGLRDSAIDGFQRVGKRLMDLLVAGIAIFFLWPVMLAVAIIIKLEDGGPILYSSARVGENGRLFYMHKFRSMVANADQLHHVVNQKDENGNLFFKYANDPRITRIGRFIRRTSIDELPQFFNVLKGEMSLVGPRPELPWLVESYAPWQRKRFSVPQGITGWWQVNGRSENPMHLHTDQDLYYIQHYSLWLDIQILWRTISVVLRGRGAY